jgi:hypothetical protein
MGIHRKGEGMMTALSKQQASDFKACVQIVRKGINTFREVGQALAKIRDEQWYKTSHKTFEAFCIEEFGFKRSHAYRLIEAAEAVETSPTGDKLTTERQARKYLDQQKHHPVAAESDDDQDADGGAVRVTDGQLAGMELDPVGDLPEPTSTIAADTRAWLNEVVRRHFDNDNGELTTAILSNELWLLSEEVLNWT